MKNLHSKLALVGNLILEKWFFVDFILPKNLKDLQVRNNLHFPFKHTFQLR
jgi:hypothetical protein